MSAFGPWGPNYSLVRPAAISDPAGGADTWCVDCSAAGANDGTILDATFFNAIIGNLRYAVATSGITLDQSSDTMVYEAIQAIAAAAVTATLTADNGVVLNGTVIETTLGKGTEPALPFGSIDPDADTVLIYDADTNATAETTPYDIVKSVIGGSTGLTDTGGELTFKSGINFTAAATPPIASAYGDQWYDTDTDTLYSWANDGSSDLWIDISS